MSVETPGLARDAEVSAAEPDAHLKSYVTTWPIVACALLCWAIFLWASGRGYEFSDEAFDLVVMSDPHILEGGLSNFGDLLHPLYLLVSGDIASLRIAGMLIVSAFGVLFGLAVSRFLEPRVRSPLDRSATVLGIAVCVFWQHQTWDATPDYNLLNLCALLLFFSGLLASVSSDDHAERRTLFAGETIGPVILCAVGLTTMALTKASTAILAVILGVFWTVFVQPRRPIASLVLTAVLTAILLIFGMSAIDGSPFEFVAAKLRALDLITPPGGTGDVHGIATSVFGVFFKQWWKVAQAALFAGIVFALGLAWSSVAITESQAVRRRWLAPAIAGVIAILTLWWRIEDLQIGQGFVGFRVWRLPLALVLSGLWIRTVLLGQSRLGHQSRKSLWTAFILTMAPVSYSVGTDNLLIWHMAGAGIFWAAAMMVLINLVMPTQREGAQRATAFLCGITSVALLLGVVIVPGRIGLPVWDNTISIPIGPQGSRVAVTPAAADYIGTFRQVAFENDFTIDTPVVDLSEMGVGLTFALGGKPLGSPFWLISDGGIPDEAERRQTIAAQAAGAQRFLAVVPATQLCNAWVITGSPTYLPIVRNVLTARGINFPENYRIVGRASRNDLGWTQVLWKPLPEAQRRACRTD